MKKYGGEMIYRGRGAGGDIEVVEDIHYRSLHFGSEATQSRMDRHLPYHLVLNYTRAMTAALLFNPQPARILLVGLGGGSLANFFHHYFPEAHIDAVEYCPEVVQTARDYFYLPDDERLRIIIDDAGHFLRNADTGEFSGYDLIMVDAFEANSIATSVVGISFYDACCDRLSANGVLSINLWSGQWINANDMLEDMRHSFDGRVLRLPVEGKGNIIGLALMQIPDRRSARLLGEVAADMQRHYRIEYPALLRTLRKLNPECPLG